jgi:hypothetical protein
MTIKCFRNVSSFQVFVPEKSGWISYRPSWSDNGVWVCEFNSQDGKINKNRVLSSAYAEDIWNRFNTSNTCETTYSS